MSVGATSLAFDAAPTIINAGTDVSTFLNASLYPAVESSPLLQFIGGVGEGVLKYNFQGTEFSPYLFETPAYKIRSDVVSVYLYVKETIYKQIRNETIKHEEMP